VGTQWAFARWSASQGAIPEIIHRHTGDDSILITNRPATRKFLRLLNRRYSFVDRAQVDAEGVHTLLEKYGVVFVAFVGRNDSEFHRGESQRNREFVESLVPTPEPTDQHISETEHLQIGASGIPRVVSSVRTEGSRRAASPLKHPNRTTTRSSRRAARDRSGARWHFGRHPRPAWPSRACSASACSRCPRPVRVVRRVAAWRERWRRGRRRDRRGFGTERRWRPPRSADTACACST
jgi:hypothetical protein